MNTRGGPAHVAAHRPTLHRECERTKLGPAADRLGAVPDPRVLREHGAPGLPGMTGSAAAPPARKMPGQLLALAPGAVDEPVDRLVAEPVWRAGLDAQPPGDLLGRPAGAQAIDHCVAQRGVPLELGARTASSRREILSGQRPVALRLRDLRIMPPVAPELAVDRRAMTTQGGRDLGDGDLRLAQPMDPPALLQAEVNVRRGHGGLRATHCPCWPVALRNGIHPRSP